MAKGPRIYNPERVQKDHAFLLEMFGAADLADKVRGYDALVDPHTLLNMGAAFALAELLPMTNSPTEKPQYLNGKVVMPEAARAAWQSYVGLGFTSLTAETTHEGMALPEVVFTAALEHMNAANMPWTMITTLVGGAYAALREHASEEVQNMFMPGLVSGDYTATMCLSESGVGTNVGDTKTKAERNEDGTYRVTGQKLWITHGGDDYAPNKVHLVLARLPGAPEGVKGLTLFAVPQLIEGAKNGVRVQGIEMHKVGLHASPTCEMGFDSAKAFIIGKENEGMRCMFTMMNEARLHVGVQAIGVMEALYQNALKTATEIEKNGQPLLAIDDVRRNLLFIRSLAEAGRAMAMFTSMQIDVGHHHVDPAERERAQAWADMLTPVVKAYFTRQSIVAAQKAQEIYGGTGFTFEAPIAQMHADLQITTVYEGINPVQAAALLRSLNALPELLEEIQEFTVHSPGLSGEASNELLEMASIVSNSALIVNDLMDSILREDKCEQLAVAAKFLEEAVGPLMSGYMLLYSAVQAQEKLRENPDDKSMQGKVDVARYFIRNELQKLTDPRKAILAGRETMQIRDVWEAPGKKVEEAARVGSSPGQAVT